MYGSGEKANDIKHIDIWKIIHIKGIHNDDELWLKASEGRGISDKGYCIVII